MSLDEEEVKKAMLIGLRAKQINETYREISETFHELVRQSVILSKKDINDEERIQSIQDIIQQMNEFVTLLRHFENEVESHYESFKYPSEDEWDYRKPLNDLFFMVNDRIYNLTIAQLQAEKRVQEESFAQQLAELTKREEEKEEFKTIENFSSEAECYAYRRDNLEKIAVYETTIIIADSILKSIPIILIASLPLSFAFYGLKQNGLTYLSIEIFIGILILGFIRLYQYRTKLNNKLLQLQLYNHSADKKGETFRTPDELENVFGILSQFGQKQQQFEINQVNEALKNKQYRKGLIK